MQPVKFILGLLFFGTVVIGCQSDDELFDDYLLQLESVTDVEGNQYRVINLYGKQWFVENLRSTVLNDGTPLFNFVLSEQWSTADSAGYCWYDNNPDHAQTYGALYNWHAVNTGKLCPEGWRVPNEIDWQMLIDSLGGEKVAGGKLKQKGTEFWKPKNTGATNSSKFRALPGGYRNLTGEFKHLGEYGFWWSTTTFDQNNAWYRCLYYYSERSYRNYFNKRAGFSVRCVKDAK